MADKSSRPLVLYAASHAALLARGGGGKGQLDAFASCGFLPVHTPVVNEDGGDRNSNSILELARLLDVYDALYPAKDGEIAQVDPQELVVPKLSERFDSGSGSSSKDTRIIDRAFTLLGFAEGNVQDASKFDLVFVHAAMENTASKLGKLGMKTDLNRLDKLVASVMEAVPVGSAVAARIHVSVILSYGSATANKEEACLILNSSSEIDSDLKFIAHKLVQRFYDKALAFGLKGYAKL
ncbi:unnamed protein product [Triticum turgidum subsp. durum]|uniref:Uncharacterized protein n=1 Tax=Triticum turgidum subsp. durum TaxID=4567 RepID=A0A9R1R9V2_TRITD|nr:unnamed protein product [Triticum turgidum subsp. durum]